MSAQKSDLEALIDGSRFGPAQIRITALCASVAMADGFDTQSIALAAPDIAADWGVMPGAFGIVFGAGLLGSLLGALSFGSLADRMGRKPSLLAAVGVFALASLVTPFTTSVPGLILVRLVTGLGLGGALPAVISLTSEYAPRRLRATVVGIMFCGFPLGAVIGGIAAAGLIPAFGWQSLFYVGSLVPLLLLPLIEILVPESIRYLAMVQDRPAIYAVLEQMKCESEWNGQIPPAAQVSRASVASLFRDGRALGTLLLSLTFLLSLLLSYFLVNWLPLVARRGGFGMTSAVLAVAALNLGAIVGCLLIGRLADRHGPTLPVSGAYGLGAGAIALIGTAQSDVMFLATAFAAGFLSIGAQMCMVALCATFYGTPLRATGVGWSLGIGRVGAIFGPSIGGMLISAGMVTSTLFLIAGGVSMGAGAAVLAVGWLVLRERTDGS
jgi:AAHS family 4-hydroxybenzoate transporter-like MFS transporter